VLAQINLAIYAIITGLYLLKRAPLLFTKPWKDYPPKKYGFLCWRLIYTAIVNFLGSFTECLKNPEFLMIAWNMSACVIGLVYNPFVLSISLVINIL